MAEATEKPDKPETREQFEARMAIVDALALMLVGYRAEAIEAREQSGIERQWAEDEAHYDGRDGDDVADWTKGRTMSDGMRANRRSKPTQSTVFLNITAPYTNAAAARVGDMLQPTDDRNWLLKATTLPDILEGMKDERPVAEALPPQAKQGLMAKLGGLFRGPQAQPAIPPDLKVADVAKKAHDDAADKAKKAQDVIDDWHVETRYHSEVRRLIETAAKLGVGILKGPTPKIIRKRKITQQRGADGSKGWAIELEAKVVPHSKAISPWNFYPSADCGEDIHSGSYVWERDDISGRAVEALKAEPGYIGHAIDAVLEEGPCDEKTGQSLRQKDKPQSKNELFTIWYYTGYVKKEDMEAAGCKCGDKSAYPCTATIINNRIIKIARASLDSGEFPYDVMVWQSKEGSWAGVGVPRLMRTPQRGVNAAVRNLMDNAGRASGPMLVVNKNAVVPANGVWEIKAGKVWWTKDEASDVDVSKAFINVAMPMLQEQLMPIIQFWLQKAEDTTGLPMLLQGQMGGQNPTDKVGIAQIMNNNGSTVLRRIARRFDDVTERHVGRYYEWLLIYGPDDAKGDFSLDAVGSSALVQRDAQAQQLPWLVAQSLNPAYGLDPEQVMAEFLKGLQYDTKRLVLSDEKKAELAQRQPPMPPQVQAAQIREAGATQRKQMELQARDAAEQRRDQLTLQIAEMEDRLARDELSADEQAQLQDHKVALAKLVMELNTQKELAPGPQLRTPPVEPPGKAPAGMAYPQ